MYYLCKMATGIWAGFFAVFVVGCEFGDAPDDYLKIEAVRGKLAVGLPSYSSFDEVKSFLNLGDDQIVVFEDSHSPATAHRPQFDIFSIIVENFAIDGYTGKLRLTFFNDRLSSTRFYPQAFGEFVSSLELDRTALQSEAGVMKDSFTRMWIYNNPALRQEPYLGWQDVRLAKQSSYWITKYS